MRWRSGTSRLPARSAKHSDSNDRSFTVNVSILDDIVIHEGFRFVENLHVLGRHEDVVSLGKS